MQESRQAQQGYRETHIVINELHDGVHDAREEQHKG